MAKTLYIEDKLIGMLVKHFNLHWNDEGSIPCLLYVDGVVFSADDYEYLEIPPTKVMWESGTEMVCDGILFFGDGCMEFHSAYDCEAFNWDYFTDESIRTITDIVAEIVR